MGESVPTLCVDNEISGGIYSDHFNDNDDDFDPQQPREATHFTIHEPCHTAEKALKQVACHIAARAERPQSLISTKTTDAKDAGSQPVHQEERSYRNMNPWMEITSARVQMLIYAAGLIHKPKVESVTDDFDITTKGIIHTRTTKYIQRLMKNVEETPNIHLKHTRPMDHDYHHDLNDAPILSEDDHSIHRMILGSVQSAVMLGRLDAANAVTTMDRYTAMPRNGHLQTAIRTMGYLKRMCSGQILNDPRRPDYSNLKVTSHYWGDPYHDTVEEIDDSNPLSKGREVILSCFIDTDILTFPRRSHLLCKLSHQLFHGNPFTIAGGGEYQRGAHPSWIEITPTIKE